MSKEFLPLGILVFTGALQCELDSKKKNLSETGGTLDFLASVTFEGKVV